MHELLQLVMNIRGYRKAKAIVALKQAAILANNEEYLRTAMGYAWEVGNGAALAQTVVKTPSNPFADVNWREGVIDNVTS